MYPRYKYHPHQEPLIVNSAKEESKLGSGWFDSPAEYGVETCPGLEPDPAILANKGLVESEKKPKKSKSQE